MAEKKTFGKAKLGSGKRFANCVEQMKGKYGVEGAKKVCASIGRKAYGDEVFNKLAQKGRKKKKE